MTFDSDSSGRPLIAAQRWDLDDDGDFDDGTGATASRAFSSLGGKTVRLQVTDDEGEIKTVTQNGRHDPQPQSDGRRSTGRRPASAART